MIKTQILKHLPGQERAREEGAKEMSGEEQCRRVGVSGSLRGRRSKEMIRSNTSSLQGRKYLLSPRGVMAIEVPQNEEISGGGKNGGRKGVSSAIRQRGANRGVFTLRSDSEEELLREMLTPA